jgi:hypothetical protein
MNPLFQDLIGAVPGYDLVGAEDIVGQQMALGAQYDQLDAMFGNAYPMYVGGPAHAGAAAQAYGVNPGQLATQLASHHSAMVVPRQVTKARRYPLGFPTTILAAGATALVQSNPQVPFRSGRLFIPSDIAGALLLRNIIVGKNSCLANANPVPGRMFSETSFGVEINFDTAQISQTITLDVQNTSGAQVTFNAGIMGTAVE